MRMFRRLFSDSVDYGGKNKMYVLDRHRYENMIYNRCGESGLKLPAISLGLWRHVPVCEYEGALLCRIRQRDNSL